MSTTRQEHATLAYYQPSPVRGQLEPYEPQSRPGWRYLQCTDTPNELKVLLPPKTALLYSQLLQLEVSQLAMGRNADWDRILHIRHLKDRMIRKCQRLSRTAHTPGTIPAAFRIVHAPPDFRLKEMERWLRDHVSRRKGTREVRRQPSAETANTQQSQSSQRAYTQTQPTSRAPQTPRVSTSATPVQRLSSTRPPAGVRRQGSGSSRSSNYGDSRASTESPRQRPTAYTQNLPPRNPYLSPVVEERSETATPITNPYGETPPQIAVEEATSSSPPTVREALSPDPLPHLYRPPSMLAPMAEVAAAMLPDREEPVPEPVPVPQVQEMPEPLVESFLPSELPMGMPQPSVPIDLAFDQDPVAGPSRPPLVRRRSSLRQGGGRSSANGTPKVVSWAMDRDWADYMTKFDHVVYAAEFAGNELEEARKKFQEEISNVQILRTTIASALERLRLESDSLQREEAALRAHEERVVASFDRLRQKEVSYKDRVQAVVDESKRAVLAADNRRESAGPS